MRIGQIDLFYLLCFIGEQADTIDGDAINNVARFEQGCRKVIHGPGLGAADAKRKSDSAGRVPYTCSQVLVTPASKRFRIGERLPARAAARLVPCDYTPIHLLA